MNNLRLISRIDVKNEFVIKGVHLEGLRKVGNPIELATKYYNHGIDEIIFMDAVASLYNRNNLFHIINEACKQVFIPITIGGGIRSIEDINLALKAGADKIAINTQAVKNPDFIIESSRIFGSQCIVGSIEAKLKNENFWEVYIDNGRTDTGINVIEWAKILERNGVGEIMITSIDKEGTKKGFDIDLIKSINNNVSIPVIASGGGGDLNHLVNAVNETDISGLAIASILHYNLLSISEIKNGLLKNGIQTRNDKL